MFKFQITSTKLQINSNIQWPIIKTSWARSLSNQFDFSTIEKFFLKCLFWSLNFGQCDLPFDLAQGGGESLDFAQDREPVERFVEPFGICNLLFEIFYYWNPNTDTPGPDLTLYGAGR